VKSRINRRGRISVLDKIVDVKKREVAEKKRSRPIKLSDVEERHGVRDFESSLTRPGVSIIAEIKRKSPSAGQINTSSDPISIALKYEESGADAISILTDESFFGGRDEFVSMVREKSSLPILRKEFIIDEYQILESRLIYADGILLIARILTQGQLKSFIAIAHSLGLSSLVEIHSKEDLDAALSADAKIIGINNRDLDTLKIDLGHSIRMKELIPEDRIVVSESGIRSSDDIKLLRSAGFDAVLVGEVLMSSKNMAKKLRSFKKICLQ